MLDEILHIYTDGDKAVTLEAGGRWSATIAPLQFRLGRWQRLVWPVHHDRHRVAVYCPIAMLELSWRAR